MHSQLKPVRKITAASIASQESLCRALGFSVSDLEKALALPLEARYSSKTVPKREGHSRTVHNPHKLIRKIQRKINSQIFSDKSIIDWPTHIYGSIPNQEYDPSKNNLNKKDYIACAARHCGARSLLKMDISEFFDNIHRDLVHDIFVNALHYQEPAASILTDLCCNGDSIVQGALTSSYIAALCLHKSEQKISLRLAHKGLTYTRYVDDITVSSKKLNTDFTYAQELISGMLIANDLPVNHSKTQICRISTVPLTVHGLRIGFSSPRLPADEVKRIRSAVHNVEKLAKEPNYITSHSYRHDFNRCLGRVNKLARVGHSQHDALVTRLNKIRPKPSPKDILRARSMLTRLEKDYLPRGHTYWYKARFYRLQERLNVLKRTYHYEADEIREKLRNMNPREQ